MIVTFVSECEKKALKKTRRVLDSFANRIGERTWQTPVTMQGLNAVKRLLRKTASKNTAVACHRVHGKSRTELLWIVGNRNKFNRYGEIPVSETEKDILNLNWENTWHYLPLVKSLVAIAALFHDFGKASELFQEKLKSCKSKLKGDPLRHEWISCLIFSRFVNNCGDDDKCWLIELSNGRVNQKMEKLNHNMDYDFSTLPVFASLVVWLILSHHKLPVYFGDKKKDKNRWKAEFSSSVQELLGIIEKDWGYQNYSEEEDFERRLSKCFDFPYGLPWQFPSWQKQCKKWATKAFDSLVLLEKSYTEKSWRSVLLFSRLSLLLGDHLFSSQESQNQSIKNVKLFANTDSNGELKQTLEEHLLGVQKKGLRLCHLLPYFQNDLPFAKDVKFLKKKAFPHSMYYWQDKAVQKINEWRLHNSDKLTPEDFGCFIVNMASTGCGKTIANAKIMRVLSEDSESLRYILALGLRTLTLQTGDEYRTRIGLDETELAVIIGSQAIKELHEDDKSDDSVLEEVEIESPFDIDFDSAIPESMLTTVIQSEKHRKLLYAPVLTCTIDHIILSTEVTRGGRWVLPLLRLMSSDLVIDEVDDFSGNDLIAVGRLIHLAGLLGRKVMISSATIPPAVAEGFYKTYIEGREVYANFRNQTLQVGCVWVDEFRTTVQSANGKSIEDKIKEFKDHHKHFIELRVQSLREHEKKKGIRRKGYIIPILKQETESDECHLIEEYYQAITNNIIELHNDNATIDPESSKKVSFGCVRMANIQPCIDFAKWIVSKYDNEKYDFKVMTYHSRQVLLLRHEQEAHLDTVLKNKGGQKRGNAFCNSIIRNHIDSSSSKNVVFIVVATPVEEVGRDHDFDWAIVEPSSMRSIIQLAGRVRRHRSGGIIKPNIALLQYNLRALKQRNKKPAFIYPGFENEKNLLDTHDLCELLKEKDLKHSINAIPRIRKNSELHENKNLADLEHHAIAQTLTNYERIGPEAMGGWLNNSVWWLTGMPQYYAPFRKSKSSTLYYTLYNDELAFCEKEDDRYKKIELPYGIVVDKSISYNKKYWLIRDYYTSLVKQSEKIGRSIEYTSRRFGEIEIAEYLKDRGKLEYSDQFGLSAE
ncbi:MAG: type I-F CRISPR-associated helicase Cas3f [Spirochaetia bacterium]